jgi:hypothetical protein
MKQYPNFNFVGSEAVQEFGISFAWVKLKVFQKRQQKGVCGAASTVCLVTHFVSLNQHWVLQYNCWTKGLSGQENFATSFDVSNPRFVTQLRFSS